LIKYCKGKPWKDGKGVVVCPHVSSPNVCLGEGEALGEVAIYFTAISEFLYWKPAASDINLLAESLK